MGCAECCPKRARSGFPDVVDVVCRADFCSRANVRKISLLWLCLTPDAARAYRLSPYTATPLLDGRGPLTLTHRAQVVVAGSDSIRNRELYGPGMPDPIEGKDAGSKGHAWLNRDVRSGISRRLSSDVPT